MNTTEFDLWQGSASSDSATRALHWRQAWLGSQGALRLIEIVITRTAKRAATQGAVGRPYVPLNCFASPALQILDLAGTFVLAIQPMRAQDRERKTPRREGPTRGDAARSGLGGKCKRAEHWKQSQLTVFPPNQNICPRNTCPNLGSFLHCELRPLTQGQLPGDANPEARGLKK